MARLKAAGFQVGASDLFLMIARRKYHGLWIEMKKPRSFFPSASAIAGAASPAQLEFGGLRLQAGYAFVVSFGADEAIRAIENYLADKEPQIKTVECPRRGAA